MPQGGMMNNNQMPPMDNPQPQMDNQMSPMNDMGGSPQGDEEQFDADFDAGVEADENSDPKRFIQQLAGKLSQSLRKYNEGLPNPDVDLNKYVAGMTNDAAVEGLPPEDVEEIISKIKSDVEKQDMPQDNVETPPMDNNQDMNQSPEMPPMENKKSTKKLTENLESYIDEIVNDIISQKPNKVSNDKITVNKSFKTKPYTSPVFK